MIDLIRMAETLKNDLMSKITAPDVRVVWNDRGQVFIFVVSPSYEDMDEGDRQAMAWGSVLKLLDDAEQEVIEFIFTDAPSEIEVEAGN